MYRAVRFPRPHARPQPAGARIARRVLLCCLGALILNAFALVIAASPVRSAPAGAPSAQSAIAIENSYPGDPTWDNFSAALQDNLISGYASAPSINKGQSITFYVTTTAPSFSIAIYRTGWYHGAGARLMESLGAFPGVQQPMPTPDPTTGLIECHWSPTTTLNVPTTWTSGVYLAKLTSSTGNSSFIIFVVRDDGGNADMLVQISVATYQAYNLWGGISLYSNTTDKSIYPYAHATKVSFDRPYEPGDSNGAGQYLFYEYPFIAWAEEQGFSISYTTDVDTGTSPNPLLGHKTFVVLGHDEYWSMGMRTNIQNAINAGVNVAVFSGNTGDWQVRFEADSNGVANRTEVGYKDFATQTTAPGPDPELGVNNAIVTTHWRDDPVDQPQNALLGVMWEDVNKPDQQPYVVSDASSWVFAGTGLSNGSTIPGIVGYEYDRVFNNGLTPPGLTVLSSSPVTGEEVGPSVSNSTIYTAPSGAMVFDAGTIEWSWGLYNFGSNNVASQALQQITANILYKFTGTTPPPPPPPLPQGTYLLDGFESGSLGQWMGPYGTGSVAIESSTVNSGSYALQLTNASGQYSYIQTGLSGGPGADTYTRFYFRLPSPAATATLAEGRYVDSQSQTNKLLWVVSYDAGRQGLDMYFWNGAGTRYDLYSKANIVAPDTWYGVEVEDNEQTGGNAQVWLNGAVIGSLTSTDLSTSTPYNTIQLWNDGAGTITYDDVVVSNAYNGPVGGSYPGPAATVTPTSLTFAGQNVHTTSAAQSITLTDSGTAPMTINGISLSGTNASDFSQTNTCGALLGVGASCTISVTFSPGGSGARGATLTIGDSAPSGAQTVSLSGTGVFPPPPADGVYFQDGFESGNLAQWSAPAGPGQVTVQGATVNSGSDALAIQNGSGQYADVIASLVGGGETLTYTRFYFRIAGPASATTTLAEGLDQNGAVLWLVVYDAGRHGIDAYFWNGARTRYDLYSQVNVIAPDTWYGLEVEDNEQTTGHAEIWLDGTSLDHVDGVDLSDALGVSQLMLLNEAQGTVYFDDVKVSNAYNGPVGSGYAVPGASASPASLDFGNQNTGAASAAQTITLKNTGTLPLIISSDAIGGVNAGDFATGSDTCAGATVAAGATCTVAVTFTPGAAGSRSAALVFSDNAPGATQTVSLSGTGVTPPPPPPPSNGVYFQDGFESGNLSQWSAPTGSGQASVESAVVNSGTYAAALTNGSGQTSALSCALVGGGETLTYTSFAFRVAGPTPATSTIAEGRDGNGALDWVIVYDAGRQGLDVYVWNGAHTRYDLYTNASVIAPDTWYTVELEMNQATSGHIELWLNGSSVASFDGDTSVSAGYAQLTLLNEATGTIYFDDVKVANVQ